LMGYLQLLSSYEIKVLATRLDLQPTTDLSSLAESIRDKIIDSPSIMTLIPLQDWLLTTDRINIPGTEKSINDTNWQYQMSVAIEDLPANLI
jgi:4-alpha-glucanotransferase